MECLRSFYSRLLTLIRLGRTRFSKRALKSFTFCGLFITSTHGIVFGFENK
jgi:hypothetical protein